VKINQRSVKCKYAILSVFLRRMVLLMAVKQIADLSRVALFITFYLLLFPFTKVSL